MTKEDVIRMALEAGAIEYHEEGWAPVIQGSIDDMERFAALVAAAEREACAQVCSKVIDDRRSEGNTIGYNAIMQCAESIRARNNP